MPTDVGLRVTQVERSRAATKRLPLGVGLLVSGAASAALWTAIFWLLRHVF